MAVYTVHLQGEDLPALERAAFVREGFSWPAFVFGPFWLVWHRLWLALIVWIAVGLLNAGLAAFVTGPASFAVAVLVQLFLGVQGNQLRRAKLAHRGWRLSDIVAGSGRDEAEGWFFRGWQPTPPPAPPAADRATPARPADTNAVLGLFPEPESHR